MTEACCARPEADHLQSLCPGSASAGSDLVWYCFDVRRRDLENEVATAVPGAIADWIRARVAAGECSCRVKNPSGKCCLPEVRGISREILARASIADVDEDRNGFASIHTLQEGER